MSEPLPTTEELQEFMIPREYKRVFALWLADHDREKQAEAWEKGFRSGFDYADPRFVAGYPPVNPYREEENNE